MKVRTEETRNADEKLVFLKNISQYNKLVCEIKY
jgi:hypothetical protein